MKRSYGHDKTKAVQCITTGEFWCFLQALQHFEQEQCLHECQDAFLDAYSSYLHHGTPHDRALVESSANALHAIDPSFNFSL